MGNNDPRGYYRVLGLQPNADAAEIKVAYRRKAMELHPDRNNAPNATALFQLLNEAYALLSNPETRAQYDTISIDTGPPVSQPENASEPTPEPVTCSCCGKITAQPRYVIFYEVKSFIFVTSRSATQGIYCSSCAEKKALKASAITWIIGWWGVPWGPIYSTLAILSNLFGGNQPVAINARITAHQAWVFSVLGKKDIARAIAIDAMRFAKKVKSSSAPIKSQKGRGSDIQDEGEELRGQIQKLLDFLGDGGQGRLKDSWRLFRRAFYLQGIVASAFIGCLTAAIMATPMSSSSLVYSPPKGPKPYLAEPPLSETAPDEHTSHNTTAKPAYIRPTVAPNGKEWPIIADYVKGYPNTHKNGLSQVTVDNNHNDSDVFVKLVSLDGDKAFPVRTFFIPAHSDFTLNNVMAGSYDIRYQDLKTGGRSRSEQFTLEEIPTDNGTQYSTMTLTLYKVRHGNMRSYDLAEDEF